MKVREHLPRNLGSSKHRTYLWVYPHWELPALPQAWSIVVGLPAQEAVQYKQSAIFYPQLLLRLRGAYWTLASSACVL